MYEEVTALFVNLQSLVETVHDAPNTIALIQRLEKLAASTPSIDRVYEALDLAEQIIYLDIPFDELRAAIDFADFVAACDHYLNRPTLDNVNGIPNDVANNDDTNEISSDATNDDDISEISSNVANSDVAEDVPTEPAKLDDPIIDTPDNIPDEPEVDPVAEPNDFFAKISTPSERATTLLYKLRHTKGYTSRAISDQIGQSPQWVGHHARPDIDPNSIDDETAQKILSINWAEVPKRPQKPHRRATAAENVAPTPEPPKESLL